MVTTRYGQLRNEIMRAIVPHRVCARRVARRRQQLRSHPDHRAARPMHLVRPTDSNRSTSHHRWPPRARRVSRLVEPRSRSRFPPRHSADRRRTRTHRRHRDPPACRRLVAITATNTIRCTTTSSCTSFSGKPAAQRAPGRAPATRCRKWCSNTTSPPRWKRFTTKSISTLIPTAPANTATVAPTW